MTRKNVADLSNLDSYRRSCLDIARARLSGFQSVGEVAEALDELNAYPRLDRLSDPRDVLLLSEKTVSARDLDLARRMVLEGRVFWEHAAAGEATRLKMGTKYLIFPARDLVRLDKIAEMISSELGSRVTAEEVGRNMSLEPGRLLPLNLGQRHLIQLAYDLSRLAEDSGFDPKAILARQKNILIVNEKTADAIIRELEEFRWAGFDRQNFFFMVQAPFHGIDLKDGAFQFDERSARRLHNHGQLVMQETMDGQIFRVGESGQRAYLGGDEIAELLSNQADKISYNIEDLSYLTQAIDWISLALALKLGQKGYGMIMEVVANNPDRPIKGGLAAYDDGLGRNVMIESFQLKGIPNSEIKFLNRNFNHYTHPLAVWQAIREHGLPMHLAVKNDRIYFQPVQGDINFLVRTAFVRRETIAPIKAWKSASNTPEAVNAMADQDRQPGFAEFVERVKTGPSH